MKKLLTIILASLLIVGLTSALNDANAQDTDMNTGSVQQGDFKLGVGLAFGSGVGFGSLDNDLGIRVDGYYAFTEQIRGGGDFTFYLPKSEGETDATVWELNFNANYILLDEDGLLVYALGGINITGLNLETSITNEFGSFGGEVSETETGLNLGAGLEYTLDFADLFGEAKLGGLGGDANQFVLGVGLRFPI